MKEKKFADGELRSIVEGFGIKDAVSFAPFGSGHINDTFLAKRAGGEPFILQRINTTVFPDADAMMENISRVTAHIRSKGARTLEVLGYSRPWRAYSFIDGAETVELI